MRGICVHTAIEQFYAQGFHRCGHTEYQELRKAVLTLLEKAWQHRQAAFDQLGFTASDLVFFYHESQKMMINFLHQFIQTHGFEKPAPIIEKTLFSNPHKLLGRVDLIHPHSIPPQVLDFKTAKSAVLTDDYKRQLNLYGFLYHENFGRMPELAIHFLRFKNGVRTYPMVQTDLDDAKTLVSEIHQQTKSPDMADYPCRCGRCEYEFSHDPPP